MAKTVVHVTTLEEWKSVLDFLFGLGFSWRGGSKVYQERNFENGGKYLFFDDYITWSASDLKYKFVIEYSDFMAQQKEGNEMVTYYVKPEQLDLIEELKEKRYLLNSLLTEYYKYENINTNLSTQEERALLRYLGGDETIEFKFKEQLYRLWRIDSAWEKSYMRINSYGTPDWTMNEEAAFTAPLE